MGATLPAFTILPANVPNMALIGAAESIYGLTFEYGAYLALNFTVLGILAFLAIPIAITRFFPDRTGGDMQLDEPGAWTRDEMTLMIILAVTVAGWASDAWHGLSPAWVALAAAVLCLLPRIGVIGPDTIKSANLSPWIFVAGVIGLGAVAAHSGLAAAFGADLLARLDLAALPGWLQYAVLVGASALVGILTCLPAAPAILTPLAQTIADTTGWPLTSVLMTQVASWVFHPLPYQTPPMVVALAMGGVALGRAVPIMVCYFLFGAVFAWPLHYIWGSVIGVFPGF
jgi:hypothetical protein